MQAIARRDVDLQSELIFQIVLQSHQVDQRELLRLVVIDEDVEVRMWMGLLRIVEPNTNSEVAPRLFSASARLAS